MGRGRADDPVHLPGHARPHRKGWLWWVAAGIVGLAGALLAWKAQIMQDATEGQSPEDK